MTTTLPEARRPEAIAAPASDRSPDLRGALVDWLLKRGILFVLLMSPIAALFVGVLRLVPTRIGYLILLVAFLATPVWVVWRRSVSTDPTEPVFNVHRYALYALFPYVVFSVVRIPTFYLFDMVYWAPWQTFGFGATGNPVGFYPSLLTGAALYSLQGFALSMGFYTLFKRHSVLNAMLYYFVFISSLYSFIFPVLLLRGSQPGLPFHLTNYWAHLWMGLTAVAVPVLFTTVWPRLRARARASIAVGLTAVWLTPYAFAFTQAGLWQFSTQERLERAAFAEIELRASPTMTRTITAAQARYSLDLRLGPREYVTYSHAHKAIDADHVSIDGQLMFNGTPIARCSGAIGALPDLKKVRDPEKYFPALERLNHTSIPLTCSGPAAASTAIPGGTAIAVEYTAQMTLSGERSTTPHRFDGSTRTTLAPGK